MLTIKDSVELFSLRILNEKEILIELQPITHARQTLQLLINADCAHEKKLPIALAGKSRRFSSPDSRIDTSFIFD